MFNALTNLHTPLQHESDSVIEHYYAYFLKLNYKFKKFTVVSKVSILGQLAFALVL